MLDIKHITICYFLLDFYNILAKAQHGVCKINQILWEYDNKLEKMKRSLTELKGGTYDGQMKKTEPFIQFGIFPSGMTIATEPKKSLRSGNDLSNQTMIEDGKKIICDFIDRFNASINRRIEKSNVTMLTRQVFKEWDEDKLQDLLDIAETSDRNYGDCNDLLLQYNTLKHRFKEIDGEKQRDKWLKACTESKLYSGCEDVIHFALCCFLKFLLKQQLSQFEV